MSRLVAMAVLLVSFSAAAQTLTVAPPSLTTATRVNVTFASNTCAPFERLVRNGDVFDVEYQSAPICIGTPPPDERELDLGFLDAGSYTVRAVEVTAPASPAVTQTVPFTVAQAAAVAPVLDARGIAILALAIVISASMAMRRGVA